MKIYILSPHIDDAAFGLALTISKCANNNNVSVTIINCFTVSRWTAIYVENKNVSLVSLLRKNEDEAFYKAINHNINIVNLDLLDAPLRNGYIFKNQPFQQNELDLIQNLTKLLQQFISDGILLCPLAIGDHIDHEICREAVLNLYKKLNVIFFEDLPYAQRISEDQIRMHIHKLEEELGINIVNYTDALDKSIADKALAIQAYKSQLNDEIVSEIIAHQDALGGERLWGEENIIKEFKAMALNVDEERI